MTYKTKKVAILCAVKVDRDLSVVGLCVCVCGWVDGESHVASKMLMHHHQKSELTHKNVIFDTEHSRLYRKA